MGLGSEAEVGATIRVAMLGVQQEELDHARTAETATRRRQGSDIVIGNSDAAFLPQPQKPKAPVQVAEGAYKAA